MRNTVALVVATFVLSSACSAQIKTTTTDAALKEQVFRAPFLLKLRIDDRRFYEERFDRVPYVAEDDVYLFAGEAFGITLTIVGDRISRVIYQKDMAKADVELKFTQEESPSGLLMMLVIRNKLKQRLSYDAVMTVPGKKGVFKTTVLPVEPDLSNFESWPHPIVQLVLRDFRLSEEGAKQSER